MKTAITAALLNKDEAAHLLSVSTRTIDRWRQVYDLGEVSLTSTSNPKFRRSVLEAGLVAGFAKRKIAAKKSR